MLTDRDRIYQAAQKYLQKGQLDRAIAEYESLVHDDPSDLRALLKVGDLQLRLGNTQAASAAYLQVAESYARDGFFSKAAAVYKQIYNLEPDNVAVGEALAALYTQLNLAGEAAGQWRTLAAVHARAERNEAALAAIERAMQEGAVPSDDIVLAWAELKAKLGDGAAALDRLRQLADGHRDAGRTAAWAKVAERMLAMDDALAGVATALARHYLAQGDARTALHRLRSAFQAAPQDEQTLELLADAFVALDQLPKATAVLHQLAQQAWQRGQPHVRLQVLRRLVALDPADTDAAAALVRAEDDVQARRHGRATQRVAPPPTANGANAAVAAVGQTSTGLVSEGDLAKLVVEATVFHRYGLYRRALEFLQQILRTAPHHVEAQALQATYQAEWTALQATGGSNNKEHAANAGEPSANASQGEQAFRARPTHSSAAAQQHSSQELVAAQGADPIDANRHVAGQSANPSAGARVASHLSADASANAGADASADAGAHAGADADAGAGAASGPGVGALSDSSAGAASGHGAVREAAAEAEQAANASFFAPAKSRSASPSRPRPGATLVHAGAPAGDAARFTLGDDDLDVDALIAAAIPHQATQQVQQAKPSTEEALQALAAPAQAGDFAALAAPTAPSADTAATHYDLGIAYRDMGLYDEAIAQLTQVPSDDVHGNDARYAVGLCHLAAGRAAQAVDVLRQALPAAEAATDGGVAVIYALALAERLAGEEAQASNHLQQVAARAPHYRNVDLLLQPGREPTADGDAVQALIGGAAQAG